MYVDPLEGNGLFLLDTSESDSQEPGPTERNLPFEYKPSVDYFAKFDAMLPMWQLRPYKVIEGSGAALFDKRGAPEVKIGRRKTQTVSLRKYYRAIDPAGNLCQLTVSTVPPSPEHPTGDDGIGTMARVIAMKNQRGWIIVERDQACWNPYSGKAGDEYAAWALAVMVHRKAAHAAHEKEQAKLHKSQLIRAAEEQTKATREIGTEIGTAVAKALLEGGAGKGKGKAEKSADA